MKSERRPWQPVGKLEADWKPRAPGAFTLIELLVVIAIIGVLAALTLGVSGVATRAMKKSRMESELNFLSTQIENYKSELGSFPPDNPAAPFPSPLFYELAGCVFENGQFRSLQGGFTISSKALQQNFNRSGISNSKREARKVKFETEFNESQYSVGDGKVAPLGVVSLTAAVRGPGGELYFWNYMSTNPTNNPSRFDLWADVTIGGDRYRFKNWGEGSEIR